MNYSDFRRKCAAGGIAATCLFGAGPAAATNGYMANGYGGGAKGMAGAGVAVEAGVLGLAQNPAFGTRIGNVAGFCLTGFAPKRGYSVSGAGPITTGSQTSVNDAFLIPCGGVNFQLNDRTSLALFAFGNGGMNTQYATNPFTPGYGPSATAPLGVNLEQLFLSASLAYDVNERLSFGVAPILAIQRFSATGLENFDNASYSSSPGDMTNNGDDWSTGFGLNLGVAYEASPGLTLGASYRSRINMEEFHKYKGLFAEQGDFDIPAVATVGLAYTLPQQPRLTLTAEYQRIFYGDVKSLANTGTAITAPFGADDGPGFGWDNMDVIRVAAIFRSTDRLMLRGGVSYATQFAEKEEALLNIVAPATPQWHLSVGGTYKVNDKWSITSSFTHAFSNEISGINPALSPAQPITLRMEQNEFAIGASYRW
ncbi:OmpP1/FadL family transporter [Puniceibacterium sediminis]|uniref:Long-chain fatty acid transport protein n=1 Tax=Puniceibacterium sediminis TaxID=1608407 RepID=A0A238YI18_9RHOB|nr:outer membrane protein transport protein [Puniceibacterium sediminis]SNR70845.1 long-chain fatty acid transport protein [Puniceibacterium sediminis]